MPTEELPIVIGKNAISERVTSDSGEVVQCPECSTRYRVVHHFADTWNCPKCGKQEQVYGED